MSEAQPLLIHFQVNTPESNLSFVLVKFVVLLEDLPEYLPGGLGQRREEEVDVVLVAQLQQLPDSFEEGLPRGRVKSAVAEAADHVGHEAGRHAGEVALRATDVIQQPARD